MSPIFAHFAQGCTREQVHAYHIWLQQLPLNTPRAWRCTRVHRNRGKSIPKSITRNAAAHAPESRTLLLILDFMDADQPASMVSNHRASCAPTEYVEPSTFMVVEAMNPSNRRRYEPEGCRKPTFGESKLDGKATSLVALRSSATSIDGEG